MFEASPAIDTVVGVDIARKAYKFWTLQQETQYLKFLEENRSLFCDQTTRRSNRVFKSMAQTIATRDYNQCRSHHQKMIIRHRSIEHLIKHLRKKVSKGRTVPKASATPKGDKAHNNPLLSSTDTLRDQLAPIADQPPSWFCWPCKTHCQEIDLVSGISEPPSMESFLPNDIFQL